MPRFVIIGIVFLITGVLALQEVTASIVQRVRRRCRISILGLEAIVSVLHHQCSISIRVEVVVQNAFEVCRFQHLPCDRLGGGASEDKNCPLLPNLSAATEKSRLIYHLFIFIYFVIIVFNIAFFHFALPPGLLLLMGR